MRIVLNFEGTSKLDVDHLLLRRTMANETDNGENGTVVIDLCDDDDGYGDDARNDYCAEDNYMLHIGFQAIKVPVLQSFTKMALVTKVLVLEMALLQVLVVLSTKAQAAVAAMGD